MQVTRFTRASVCVGTVGALLVGFAVDAASSNLLIAQESRPAYLPMVFHAEARDVRSTACIQVEERLLPSTRWWEGSDKGTPAQEAFKALVSAIKRKDRPAFVKLTDATQAADAPRVNTQADAFFQQFERVELAAVSRLYEFDGLAVFWGKFQGQGKSAYAPLAFRSQRNGGFGFLPLRSDLVSYVLVQDWFTSQWGPSNTETPAYCGDADVKRATHRVRLAPEAEGATPPSYLLLTGAPVDAPGPLANLAQRAATVNKQLSTGAAKGIDEITARMTPEGAGRLKDWYAKATEDERKAYRDALTGQRPFFLFDASPLIAVYTRAASGNVQVLYFLADPTGVLLWANSSHVTVADRVFKRGPLFDAAQLEKPFSTVVIK